jgi:hypothetical protein
MSPKLIALLGHLGLAGIFVFGFGSIASEHRITFLTILFSVVGIWAAISATASGGYSLAISFLIWISIGIWKFLDRDPSQSDSHSSGVFLFIAEIATFCFMPVSFVIGRIGYRLLNARYSSE